MNTIYVNYMTRTFGGLAQKEHSAVYTGKSMAGAIMEAAKRAGDADTSESACGNTASAAAGNGFAYTGKDAVAGGSGQGGAYRTQQTWIQNSGLQEIGAGVPEPIDRSVIEAMTMDEYKEYIRERILALPMHSSHMQDTITITISDEGFAAMKRDAEYEEWVLNDLRTGWAWENPWARYLGGAYSVIHYGATKEECHAQMWNAGFRHLNGKTVFDSMSEDDDRDDKKRKQEIVVKPDGTRYLVISEVISGMKVTVMSIKLTDPDELMQDTPDLANSAAAQVLAKGGAEPA